MNYHKNNNSNKNPILILMRLLIIKKKKYVKLKISCKNVLIVTLLRGQLKKNILVIYSIMDICKRNLTNLIYKKMNNSLKDHLCKIYLEKKY